VIKVECDADVQSEEDSPEMKTDDVCIPSPFAVYIAEPQVILPCCWMIFEVVVVVVCVCICVCVCARAHVYLSYKLYYMQFRKCLQ
jgi:hypothetical protein